MDCSPQTTRPCGIDFSPGLCRSEPGNSLPVPFRSKAFMTSYLAQFARLCHANFTTYVARKTSRQLKNCLANCHSLTFRVGNQGRSGYPVERVFLLHRAAETANG